ncbi:uncharacterized protein LOC129317390 [Prosopis cineraria]|uniref:uncharacterized protein LOC129317390 n=1 Tax=Prosopis cineraria TaxID=364024 RepID=UPI00240FE9BA|nr:uncharacterized protein LOC129317390 [Prosopis cineraria]
MHRERIHVCPFSVSHMVNEADLRLIQYVFEQSCSDEKIFSSPRLHLTQSDFITLRPEADLNSWVIDIFVYILTETERKKSKPLNLYLPVMFSNEALKSDVSSFLNFVERHNMRENYMFHLNYCEKLLAMDKFLGVAVFTKFLWTMAINIPLQPNGYDCGIFVIKYMQQSDNFVRQNPSFQFDSNKERLDLALEFLNSDLNQEKKTLYDKVARRCKQGKTAIERKWVDTCKTLSEDVGRGACMELVASDNRVKRKNASLEKDVLKVMNCQQLS